MIIQINQEQIFNWIPIIEAALSLLFSGLLVALYYKQSRIQEQQKDIMEVQARIQKNDNMAIPSIHNVAPYSQSDNGEIEDGVTYGIENRGGSVMRDIQAWLTLRAHDSSFETLKQSLLEEHDFELNKTLLHVEGFSSGSGGNLDPPTIGPGEQKRVHSRLFVHNEDGHAVYLSNLFDKIEDCDEIDSLDIHLSIIYRDAVDEWQEERVFGGIILDIDNLGEFDEVYDQDMLHGLVLKDGEAIDDFLEHGFPN